jgi:hypothetical protein
MNGVWAYTAEQKPRTNIKERENASRVKPDKAFIDGSCKTQLLPGTMN